MTWRDLRQAGKSGSPKLDRLARAARKGLRVPPTVWAMARNLSGEIPAPDLPEPWIVRSASPTEDLAGSSQAGQFHSERVQRAGDLAAVVERVCASLPSAPGALAQGAVFIQTFVQAESAGVAFFDGHHFERSSAEGDNEALTAGRARGEVLRGALARDGDWSRFLQAVAACFPEDPVIDLEWARDQQGWILLQVRPAAFAVKRDPWVSLANHREILGDLPSPWIVSALELAGGQALGYFGRFDGAISSWEEPYAYIEGGRAWMNFEAFFRLMDRWGLPRTMVTEGVGGGAGELAGGSLDGRVLWGRFLRSSPRLVALQLNNLWTVLRMRRGFHQLDEALAQAGGLQDLHRATVLGLELALRTNFAVNGALAGMLQLRRALRVRGGARVITGEMRAAYERLRARPVDDQPAGLDQWIEAYGHRGPLESDPWRARFAEMVPALLEDLASGGAPSESATRAGGGAGPLFWLDRRREVFRDSLMKRWSLLRAAILKAAEGAVARGELERAEDVFFLGPDDFSASEPMADRAAAARKVHDQAARLAPPPHTARLSEVLGHGPQRASAPGSLIGIGLGGAPVEGRVRRAEDLVSMLAAKPPLGPGDLLVVAALEPAWGVLFGRVGGVIAELGGELSHGSILLREAGTPAVVNCEGAWSDLREGERVRLDPESGQVTRMAPAGEEPA